MEEFWQIERNACMLALQGELRMMPVYITWAEDSDGARDLELLIIGVHSGRVDAEPLGRRSYMSVT